MVRFGEICSNYNEILIKLLDYCDFNCIMCGQISQTDRHNRLPISLLEKFFDYCDLTNKRVYIWGGEPLLHPDLCKIISLFKAQGAIVAINTNGHLLDHYIEKFVELKLDRIVVSLDGADKWTHDSIRGLPGVFDSVMKAIRRLRKIDRSYPEPLIRINFVVLPLNYHQIPKVISLCKEEFVYKIQFQFPMFLTPTSRAEYSSLLYAEHNVNTRDYSAFQNTFEKIDYAFLREIMAWVERDQRSFARFFPFSVLSEEQLKYYFTSNKRISQRQCEVFNDKIAIDSSGRLVTCPDFPDLDYGDMINGITKRERLSWLKRQFESDSPLPTCFRCCHFVPVTEPKVKFGVVL